MYHTSGIDGCGGAKKQGRGYRLTTGEAGGVGEGCCSIQDSTRRPLH